MTTNEFRALVASVSWTFAKTMPDIPHEYIVRKNHDSGAFTAAVALIQTTGYVKQFGDRDFTYLDVDGYSYWTMGETPETTVIINRAVTKP